MSPIIRRRSILLAALSILLLVLSSCGAPGPVTVTMSEYAFKLSQPNAKSGKVTFRIVNGGSIVHEMVVVQTDLAADKLPKGADGSVDEEKLAAMGEQGDIDAGKSVDLTLDLPAGRYMLICNLPGHFQQGMYTDFTVTS